MKVSELLDKHGSDKNCRNGYGDTYDELLTPRRESITSLLEIGIFCGASLRAWRDFLPNAQVVGLDTQPRHLFTEQRIETFLCNGADKNQLDGVLQNRTFDVIIDDGSHWIQEQILSLTWLWPRLKAGGVYIIEDILSDLDLLHMGFIGNAVVVDNSRRINLPGATMLYVRKE